MTILQGLKLIDKYNLPHPRWEFVKDSQDLKKFYKIKDYVGWTIRTVEIKNGKWKNLYVNWLAKNKVPEKLDELAGKQKGRALFVVYPSWKWKKGGTVLIEKQRTVIEAVKGEIEKLMRKGILDASYYFKNNKLVNFTEEKDFLSPKIRKSLLKANKIKKNNIILEWALTTQNKLIFYRAENIKKAGQLLLEKYQ